MNVIRLAEIREEPLSVEEVRAAVSTPGAGAIALFAGTVRDQESELAAPDSASPPDAAWPLAAQAPPAPRGVPGGSSFRANPL